MKQSRPAIGSRAVSEFNPLTSDRNDLSRGTHAVSGGKQVTSGKRLALGGIAPLSPFLPLPAAHMPEQDEDDEEPSRDSGMSRAKSSLGHGSNLSASSAMMHSRQHRSVTMPRSEVVAAAPAPLMIRSYSLPVATQQAYDAARKAEVARRSGSSTQYCSTPSGRRTPLATVTPFDMNMTPMTTDRLANTAMHSIRQPASSSLMKRPSYHREASSETDELDEVQTPRAISPLVVDIKNTHLDDDASTDDYFTSTHRPAHVRPKQHQDLSFTIHPDHLAPPSTTLL